MARQRRYVRQMPKIYGNLQKPAPSYEWVGVLFRRVFYGGIALVILYGLFFTGWLTIKKVEVEGAVFSSESSALSHVKTGSPIWALSSAEVRSAVLQDPAVDSVAVLRGLPDSVKIVVQEKKPAMIWLSGQKAIVLDDSGQAFFAYPIDAVPSLETPAGEMLASLPQVVDTKALPVELGDPVVSPLFLSFVSSVEEELSVSFPEFQMDHMEISDTTYDLTVIAKQGLRVSLNTLGDAGVQIRNLTRLVEQDKANLTSKVDLRIDRWAYVKP